MSETNSFGALGSNSNQVVKGGKSESAAEVKTQSGKSNKKRQNKKKGKPTSDAPAPATTKTPTSTSTPPVVSGGKGTSQPVSQTGSGKGGKPGNDTPVVPVVIPTLIQRCSGHCGAGSLCLCMLKEQAKGSLAKQCASRFWINEPKGTWKDAVRYWQEDLATTDVHDDDESEAVRLYGLIGRVSVTTANSHCVAAASRVSARLSMARRLADKVAGIIEKGQETHIELVCMYPGTNEVEWMTKAVARYLTLYHRVTLQEPIERTFVQGLQASEVKIFQPFLTECLAREWFTIRPVRERHYPGDSAAERGIYLPRAPLETYRSDRMWALGNDWFLSSIFSCDVYHYTPGTWVTHLQSLGWDVTSRHVQMLHAMSYYGSYEDACSVQILGKKIVGVTLWENGVVEHQAELGGTPYSHPSNAPWFCATSATEADAAGDSMAVNWKLIDKTGPAGAEKFIFSMSADYGDPVPARLVPEALWPTQPLLWRDGLLMDGPAGSLLAARTHSLQPSVDSTLRSEIFLSNQLQTRIGYYRSLGLNDGILEKYERKGKEYIETLNLADPASMLTAGLKNTAREHVENAVAEVKGSKLGLSGEGYKIWDRLKTAKNLFDVVEILMVLCKAAADKIRELVAAFRAWRTPGKNRPPPPVSTPAGLASAQTLSVATLLGELLDSFDDGKLVALWAGLKDVKDLKVLRRVVNQVSLDRVNVVMDIVLLLLGAAGEEVFKRLVPGGAFVISVSEIVLATIVQYRKTGFSPLAAMEQLPNWLARTTAHVALAAMPFGLGVAFHACYNVVVAMYDPASPLNRALAQLRYDKWSEQLSLGKETDWEAEEGALPMERLVRTRPVPQVPQVEKGKNLKEPITITVDHVETELTQEIVDHIREETVVKDSGLIPVVISSAVMSHASPGTDGLLSLLSMVKNRLNLAVKGPKFAALQGSLMTKALKDLQIKYGHSPTFVQKTFLEYLQWIMSHDGWNNTKKQTYVLAMWENEGQVSDDFFAGLRQAVELFVKCDETLIVREIASMTIEDWDRCLRGFATSDRFSSFWSSPLGDMETKDRPIFAVHLASEIRLMMFMSDIKAFFSKVLVVAVTPALCGQEPQVTRLALDIDELMDADVFPFSTASQVYVFAYLMVVNSGVLSSFVTKLSQCRVIALLAHGDDSQIVSFVKGRALSAAFDFRSCDLTTSSARHAAIYSHFESFGLPTDIRTVEVKRMKAPVEASFRHPWKFSVTMRFVGRNTLTGGPLTSIVAASSQEEGFLTATEDALAHLGKNEPEDQRSQLLSFVTCYQNHLTSQGFDLEPELSAEGDLIMPLPCTTFLAQSAFVDTSAHTVTYAPISYLKNLKFNPSLYDKDVRTGVAKGMYAMGMQPELGLTPIGREIERLCKTTSAFSGTLTDRQKAAALDALGRVIGSYQTEVKGKEERVEIPEDVFFLNYEIFCEVKGIKDGVEKYHAALSSFRRLTRFFDSREEIDLDVMFEARYGKRSAYVPLCIMSAGVSLINSLLLGPAKTKQHVELSHLVMKAKGPKQQTKVLNKVEKKVEKKVENAIKKQDHKVIHNVGKQVSNCLPEHEIRRAAATHAGVLAHAEVTCCHDSEADTKAPILGVGASTAHDFMFKFQGEAIMVANQVGFCCFGGAASGWTPDPIPEVTQPAFSTIGGPIALGGAINRGPTFWYTDGTYAGGIGGGVTADANQMPAAGTLPQGITWDAGTPMLGLTGIALPDEFIYGQTPIEWNYLDSNQIRQTFRVEGIQIRVEPMGYENRAAGAVSVLSGRLMVGTWKSGDNRANSPNSPLNIPTTIPSYTWVTQLPPSADLVAFTEWSIPEWKRGMQAYAFALPTSATAFGYWPAYTVLAPQTEGDDPTTVVTPTIQCPDVFAIVDGAQPGQSFRVSYTLRLAVKGLSNYSVTAPGGAARKPVDATVFSDVIMRTLPEHAAPTLVKDGGTSNAHVKAYMQSIKDCGDPSPMTTTKAVAKSSDSTFGTTIGEVLEIGAGILGALL